jgi:hypothetical protein
MGLPCVVEKTHNTQVVCRAFYFGRTAKFFKKTMFHFFGVRKKKILRHASWRKRSANKIFAVRFISSAQQRASLYFFFCRAPYIKRTAKNFFAARLI